MIYINTKCNKNMASKNPKYFKVEDVLKGKLTKQEMKLLPRAFDTIGSVIVLELPEELVRKEKTIGQAFLKVHKNIKTVCKRAGIHSGEFGIRPVKVIAGDPDTETFYKESGAVMKLDVSKTYFTPRLSHERERIAGLVKSKETIGYFFAGVGPFGFVIARAHSNVKIYAVELNPDAFGYLEENIRLNRCQTIIEPILGDVRDAPEFLKGKCNRILMPLPKGAETFLNVAFDCAAKDCIIHFYQFAPKNEPFKDTAKKVLAEAKKQHKKVKIVDKRVIRPYSPSVVQIVLDIKVL